MSNAAAWIRVSTGHQDSDNQVPDIENFAAHHGHEIAARYTVSESAWNGGRDGGEYRATLQQALDDAWAGKFSVIIIWALDRITREGAEGALRIIRQFRERGCTVISIKESWLNGSPEVQDVLVAFAGWMAQVESGRRGERIRAGLARRRAEGLPIGRQPGSADKTPRKRSGYIQRWERERQSGAQ
jgi:putative DNA-invertase from lambdoid prophage Rac